MTCQLIGREIRKIYATGVHDQIKNGGIAQHGSDTAIFMSISIYGCGDYFVSFSSAAAVPGAVVTSVAGTTL